MRAVVQFFAVVLIALTVIVQLFPELAGLAEPFPPLSQACAPAERLRSPSTGASSNPSSALGILCCNWNTVHKGADFWAGLGVDGPVGAIMRQITYLLECQWILNDPSVKVLIFYQQPPPGIKGLSYKMLGKLSGHLKDKIQIVDVTSKFVPPTKYENATQFKGGMDQFGLGYRTANQFWSQKVFELPEVAELEYLMRIDEDGTLECGNEIGVFETMRRGNYLYGYYKLIVEIPDTSVNLGKLFNRYICKRDRTTAWPLDLQPQGKNWGNAPTYYNDFEAMHVPHFRSVAVQDFTADMVASHGLYDYRWADGSVRFGQVALCLDPHKVLCFLDYDLTYSHQGSSPRPEFCTTMTERGHLASDEIGPMIGSRDRRSVSVPRRQHDRLLCPALASRPSRCSVCWVLLWVGALYL